MSEQVPTHIEFPEHMTDYAQASRLEILSPSRGMEFYDWWRDADGRHHLRKRRWLTQKEVHDDTVHSDPDSDAGEPAGVVGVGDR